MRLDDDEVAAWADAREAGDVQAFRSRNRLLLAMFAGVVDGNEHDEWRPAAGRQVLQAHEQRVAVPLSSNYMPSPGRLIRMFVRPLLKN